MKDVPIPQEAQVFVRSPFNYDRDYASDASGVDFTGQESMTQQHFAEEVDINTIVKRFGLTGELPENPRLPRSGDFTQVTDYKTALDAVREADAGFMELPAHIRAEFDHDPQKLLEFLENDKNRARATELGLVVKPPEKTRDVVQAVDELAAKMINGGAKV